MRDFRLLQNFTECEIQKCAREKRTSLRQSEIGQIFFCSFDARGTEKHPYLSVPFQAHFFMSNFMSFVVCRCPVSENFSVSVSGAKLGERGLYVWIHRVWVEYRCMYGFVKKGWERGKEKKGDEGGYVSYCF